MNWTSITFIALFLVSNHPCQAEQKNDPISAAQDAFGIRVGPESLGLYNENNIRGFSPLVAGNARIEGLYFDQQGEMLDLLSGESEIHVGQNALGFPFPAPTGVVDWRLRSIDKKLHSSIILYAGPYESKQGDFNFQIPIVGSTVGLATGFSLRREFLYPRASATMKSYAISPQWNPSNQSSVRVFWGRGEIHDEKSLPVIYTDGQALPPLIDRRYNGPDWTLGNYSHEHAGIIGHCACTEAWTIKYGLFYSSAPLTSYFSSQFLNTSSSGLADHVVVASQNESSASTSGELQLVHSQTSKAWRQRIDLSLRFRNLISKYGESDEVEIGPANVLSMHDFAQPSFEYGAQTTNRIRQGALGADYIFSWRTLGEITLGVQRVEYKNSISQPELPGVDSNRGSWLYNSALVINMGASASAYVSSLRGLEDGGVAPDNSSNRGALSGPQITVQQEVGARYQPFNGVSVSAALYKIEKPFFGLNLEGSYQRQGIQRHQGFEFSIAGELTKALNIVAGVATTNPRVTSTDSMEGNGYSTPIGQANSIAQLNVEYSLAAINNLSLDMSVWHQSPVEVSGDGRLKTPALTLFDAGVRYQIAHKQFTATARLQAHNITNAYNWGVDAGGGLTPIQPRSYRAYVVIEL